MTTSFWIFDLDGTLTKPQHDFDGFKSAVGLPAELSILEAIAQASPSRAAQLSKQVADWEWSLAGAAQPADGCHPLLSAIPRGSCAILTRNRRDIALKTLEVIGADAFFEPSLVLGRDEATPKPSPAGIELILERAQRDAADSFMVGDYLYDMQAGKRAGVNTILVDSVGHGEWNEWVDRRITSLTALRP